MKKIFTLLFTIAILTSAFAQYGQRDQSGYDNNRDIVMNDGHHRNDKHGDIYKGRNYFTARERDMQVSQINREFDYKIWSVKNQTYMGRYQKIRQIRFLEEKRDMEIQSVIAKFRDRRNQFGDRRNQYENHNRKNRDKW